MKHKTHVQFFSQVPNEPLDAYQVRLAAQLEIENANEKNNSGIICIPMVMQQHNISVIVTCIQWVEYIREVN